MVLGLVSKSEATDDRDKIYGILGFAGLDAKSDSSHLKIVVDYTLPVETLYTTTTVSMAKSDMNLRVLGIVGYSAYRKYRSLPSWCPDYSVGNIRLGEEYHFHGDLLCGRQWKSHHPTIEHNAEQQTLTVDGFRYDTLDNVSVRVQYPDINIAEMYGLAFGLLGMAASLQIHGHSRVECLWKLMLEDKFLLGTNDDVPGILRLFFPYFLMEAISNAVKSIKSAEPSSRPEQIRRFVDDLTFSEKVIRALIRLEPESAILLPGPDTVMTIRETLLREGGLDRVAEMLGTTSLLKDMLQRVRTAGLLNDDFSKVLGQGLQHDTDDSKVKRQLQLYIAKVKTKIRNCVVGDLQYFTTSRLQLLGYGYERIDRDCEVWVLHGYPSPVLLRKKGGSMYEFCATAVVRGLWEPECGGEITRISLV
ncbi:hypothetical protein C8A03DRAFT_34906 [Achaetomium macrosporum]|uniref:Uncharacterized protein n=1 Tax=Achaetomium macrosporum TaxID=79813 RepID=A0AAN7CA29_9PEZI|nr:hypothetical protein C8A03DRAFT_34906 [Achaetomium macrosporum]